MFEGDPEREWKEGNVTARQMIRHGDWHIMFYIGFEHKHLAHPADL